MKFIGKPFSNSIHPDDIEACMMAADECIASPGKVVNVVLRKPAKKDGLYYSSSWDFSLICGDQQEPLGVIAIGHDLTETEAIARSEKEFRERFESLAESMRDGYIEVNKGLDITRMNSVGRALFLCEPEGDVKKRLNEVLPLATTPQLKAAINDTLNNLTSNICEVQLDDQRWLLCLLHPATSGIRIFLRDTTEEKSDEAQMKELLKLTMVQNDRLKNFSHIVAHNLRAHTGNIDALLKYFAVDHPECTQSELFEHLNDAANRLSDTVSNLAEVAGMTRENRDELVPIRVTQAVKHALQVVEPMRKSIGANIAVHVDDSVEVLAIPAFLDSIVLNLISNAIKYRHPNRLCSLSITLIQSERYHTLSFEDNGLGIDLNRHGAKLFGMYNTFHEHPEARGIGLFITKNQIDAMGGYIEVESTPNKGTTFHVHLRH